MANSTNPTSDFEFKNCDTCGSEVVEEVFILPSASSPRNNWSAIYWIECAHCKTKSEPAFSLRRARTNWNFENSVN